MFVCRRMRNNRLKVDIYHNVISISHCADSNSNIGLHAVCRFNYRKAGCRRIMMMKMMIVIMTTTAATTTMTTTTAATATTTMMMIMLQLLLLMQDFVFVHGFCP